MDIALAGRTADVEPRIGMQGGRAPILTAIFPSRCAIDEATCLGRPIGAMTIADRRRRERADISAQRQRESQARRTDKISRRAGRHSRHTYRASGRSLTLALTVVRDRRQWHSCSLPAFTPSVRVHSDDAGSCGQVHVRSDLDWIGVRSQGSWLLDHWTHTRVRVSLRRRAQRGALEAGGRTLAGSNRAGD